MPYDPEELEKRTDELFRIRTEMEELDLAGSDLESRSLYALAIASVESSIRFLELARIKQMEALVKMRRP